MKLSTLLRASVLATALSVLLPAQSLSADVVRNPDDTVTYTFAVSGPPRGTGFVFAAASLLPAGLHLPPYGALHLDPAALLPLGSTALDGAGRGRLDLRLPIEATNGLTLFAQALVLDANLVPRLTSNWSCACYTEAPSDHPESLVWSSEGGNAASVQFQGAARFHRIVFRDEQGRVLGQCVLQCGANNKTPRAALPLARSLRPSDTYETWESDDGQQWTPSRTARRVGN